MVSEKGLGEGCHFCGFVVIVPALVGNKIIVITPVDIRGVRRRRGIHFVIGEFQILEVNPWTRTLILADTYVLTKKLYKRGTNNSSADYSCMTSIT